MKSETRQVTIGKHEGAAVLGFYAGSRIQDFKEYMWQENLKIQLISYEHHRKSSSVIVEQEEQKG